MLKLLQYHLSCRYIVVITTFSTGLVDVEITSTPSNVCMFLSCRPLVVITTFSRGLVDIEVTSTPTRPVEKVVITSKGLEDRNIH